MRSTRGVLLGVLLLVGLAGPASAAWTRIGTIGTAADTATAATTVITTTQTVEAGNVIVCAFAKDETGTGTTDGDNSQVASVADSAGGNTWVKAHEFCNMQTSTAANGACADIWWMKAVTELASGGTITITWSADTRSDAATCDEFTITAGGTVTEAAGQAGLANDAADPGSMTVATGVVRAHLFIRASACESNDATYVADADYVAGTNATADTGTAASSMGIRIETRVATESTSAASDPTYVVADCASAMVGLDEDPALAGCGTKTTLTGAGCG